MARDSRGIELERGSPCVDGLIGKRRRRERFAELDVGGDEVRAHLGELVPHKDRLVPQPASAIVGKSECKVGGSALRVEFDGAARRDNRLVVEVAGQEEVREQRVHERVARRR